MSSESSVPRRPEKESQIPSLESDKANRSDAQDTIETSRKPIHDKSVFVNSEPMREDQVQNAVNFLSHPKVRGSPVLYRRSFLEKKGLTKEEIDEAFRRVPDPSPNVTSSQATASNQEDQLKTISGPTQALQPTTIPPGGVSTIVRPSSFHWSHALLACGFLAASGAGAAVLFKNSVIPRLKTWIRGVVSEHDDIRNRDDSRSSSLEEVTAAAKAAAMAAADVALASQEMLKARSEERTYMEGVMNLLSAQIEEMKFMSKNLRKLDKQTGEFIPVQSGSNNSWRSPVEEVDPRFSKSTKINGTMDVDLGSGRSVSMKPEVAPRSSSYEEIVAMLQRGEIPPDIKEINDKPPNPNQPPSNPRLSHRIKPWESMERSSDLQSNGGTYPISSPSPNITSNTPESFGRQKAVKITEIEPESENRPIQRTWVPPLPPSVVMPEAAAAIRHPKSNILKGQQSTDADRLIADDEINKSQHIGTSYSTLGSDMERPPTGFLDRSVSVENQEYQHAAAEG